MYQRIFNNTASDKDITKFFIYLASHSPTTCIRYKPFNQVRCLADIVKIGIFSDRPITELYLWVYLAREAIF